MKYLSLLLLTLCLGCAIHIPSRGIQPGITSNAVTPNIYFNCYMYPPNTGVKPDINNGLVCPALHNKRYKLNPNWIEEYTCYIDETGIVAHCTMPPPIEFKTITPVAA